MKCGNRQALDIWRDISTRTIKADGPDLTARQTALLLTVHLDNEPYTVRALAKRLGLGKPAIVRALDSLQALGFIRRVRDPNDKRSVFIEPTLEGAARLTDIAGIIANSFAKIETSRLELESARDYFETGEQIHFAAQ